MVKHTLAKLVVTGGALAGAGIAGAGVAAADLGPLLDTSCTYSQAEAAIKAVSPDGGQGFSASPMMQTWLHAFLDAPVEQRQKLIDSAPEVRQYTDVIVAMANTCENYPAG